MGVHRSRKNQSLVFQPIPEAIAKERTGIPECGIGYARDASPPEPIVCIHNNETIRLVNVD
jgi:hypothetical protein